MEIRNIMTVKIPKRPKMECLDIEPNPSKVRVVHEGNNPSILNEKIDKTF
jgi:hypothetical protein